MGRLDNNPVLPGKRRIKQFLAMSRRSAGILNRFQAGQPSGIVAQALRHFQLFSFSLAGRNRQIPARMLPITE